VTFLQRYRVIAVAGVVAAAACGHSAGSAGAPVVTPEYNKETGRLEALSTDRYGSGKKDAVARMDGDKLKYIEIDRNGDGRPDRWEYYSADASRTGGSAAPVDQSTSLVRAEEANGPDPTKVTRWEYYEKGVLVRVEEDTDFDGKIDTWDTYRDGALAEMAMDTSGRGKPDRKLIYGPNNTARVEVDRAGTGHFEPLPAAASPGAGQ